MAIPCDSESLSLSAKCFQCIPDGRKLDVLIYLFTQVAKVTTDPELLVNLSKCLVCIPSGRKLDVLIYVACQIAQGGGGGTCVTGGNSPPVGVPPCNYSVWIQGPGPNFGVWFGDTNGWSSSAAIAQGP